MNESRQKSQFIAVATALGLYVILYLSDGEIIRKLASVIWPWTEDPNVARVNLFMSFPSSGSRFGLAVLEAATDYTAASFYGREFVDTKGISHKRKQSVLAYEELTTGPFLTSNLTLQSGGKLLTRTYCGGHCFSHCTCEEYDISVEDFGAECTMAEDADSKRDYLDDSIISSSIVMLRNPLDNIVSRFHYEHRLHSGVGSNPHFVRWEKDYPKDHIGFREWCEYIDNINQFTEQQCFSDDQTLLELMDHVPCHSEFYKYTHWYNNAFALLGDIDAETQNVHYEDFFLRPEAQTKEVVDFLELSSSGSSPFGFKLRDYTYYYSIEDRANIIKLINYIASGETKSHLRRYLVTPSS